MLEQLVILVNTGASLSDALSQLGDFGLFGRICDTVSSGMQTGKPIDRIIMDVEGSIPAPGQLKEFLGLVKQSQVGALQTGSGCCASGWPTRSWKKRGRPRSRPPL